MEIVEAKLVFLVIIIRFYQSINALGSYIITIFLEPSKFL